MIINRTCFVSGYWSFCIIATWRINDFSQLSSSWTPTKRHVNRFLVEERSVIKVSNLSNAIPLTNFFFKKVQRRISFRTGNLIVQLFFFFLFRIDHRLDLGRFVTVALCFSLFIADNHLLFNCISDKFLFSLYGLLCMCFVVGASLFIPNNIGSRLHFSTLRSKRTNKWRLCTP